MSASETESARRRAEAEINDCPIEQVRLTVPITDDPTIPVLTVRAWLMGIVFALIEASTTGIGLFRQTPVYIPVVVWQLGSLPVGRFLARTLPTRKYRIPGTNKRFTLNPGPFSLKEHVLISLMIECGFIAPQLTQYMTILKVYYGLKVRTGIAIILNTSTQMLGFGLAGAFSSLVIDNPYMWWPSTLINVVVYRTLHKAEKRRKGSVTRLQYFCIASMAIFVYGMIPGYLFPVGASISLLCLIWKNSIWAHQIGSGRYGYGVGAFTISLETLNYGQIDPFIMPLFSINNLMFGFVLFAYVLVPIYYFNNFNYARRFPLSSLAVFDMYGKPYDEKRVMKADFTFDLDKYKDYSKLYFSTFKAVAYGFTFASLSAGLLHVLVHHGREMYHAVLEVYGYNMKTDVHGRLMQKYKRVPGSWYFILLVATLIANFITSHIGINEHMRLPPTYVILALLLCIVLAVPDMVLLASTGQGLPVGVVSEMAIGYLNRGRTFQNMLLRSFFSEVPSQVVQFCQTLKLGHYMKIPPRDMFVGQVTITLLATVVNISSAWKVVNSIPNMCLPEKLPPGSPWTCPLVKLMASNSTVWGLLGPKEVFFPRGLYRYVGLTFFLGIFLVLFHWFLTVRFPRSKFLSSIYVPTILSAVVSTPPIGAVNWWSQYFVGILNNWYIYKYHKRFWTRYNYLTASALNIGNSMVAFFVFLTLQSHSLYGPDWWGLRNFNHCPLEGCPTDPSVVPSPKCAPGYY